MTEPRRPSVRTPPAAAVLLVLLSSLLALALAEVALRLMPAARSSGKLPDYGDAVRPGGRLGPGGLLKEGFEGRLTDGRGGTVFWKNNAQGFRRTENVGPESPPGTLRILSLGDSYAAGYRVDQEQTYSRLLEKHLNEHSRPAEVLIAEIEEPVTGLYWLSREGLGFHPDAVLVGITLGNDIAQAYFSLAEGGPFALSTSPVFSILEREKAGPAGLPPEAVEILPPACVLRKEIRPLPSHRPLRLLDLLLGLPSQPIACTREPHFLFDGSSALGMFLADPPPLIEEAYRRLFRALEGYKALAREKGLPVAVLLFPQRFQVQPADWRATIEAYGLSPACFDLAAPNRKIRTFCEGAGITLIDPTTALASRRRAPWSSLYLPGGDMHWNAAAHEAFFEICRKDLESFVPHARPGVRMSVPAER